MNDDAYALFRDRLLGDPMLEEYVKRVVLTKPLVFPSADGSRKLKIAETAVVNNATFNLSSGHISIEDWVFFGHEVKILTGTHDVSERDAARQTAIPNAGRDVVIRQGAWISTGATIIGPCIVGEHAVVAAGAVVVSDVPAFAVVAGVPARTVKMLEASR